MIIIVQLVEGSIAFQISMISKGIRKYNLPFPQGVFTV